MPDRCILLLVIFFFSASYMYFMCSNDVVYCVCYFQQANNQIKESGGRFGKMIIMFVARNDL